MDWGFIISVTLTGLVVVFIILILLVVVLYFIGVLMNDSGKQKESGLPDLIIPPDTQNNSSAVKVSGAVGTDDTDDEITAVITAAIMAFSENESKRKTRKKTGKESSGKTRRTAWARAGISENTKPF